MAFLECSNCGCRISIRWHICPGCGKSVKIGTLVRAGFSCLGFVVFGALVFGVFYLRVWTHEQSKMKAAEELAVKKAQLTAQRGTARKTEE